MIIGKLDRQVDLYRADKTADGRGGFTTAWVKIGTVWAEFKVPPPQTQLQIVNGAATSLMTQEIGVRYRTDVRKGWRVKYGTRTFNVIHTYDFRRETTILVCWE